MLAEWTIEYPSLDMVLSCGMKITNSINGFSLPDLSLIIHMILSKLLSLSEPWDFLI